MISLNLAREILDERHALVYRGDDDTWVSLVGDAELRRVWRESVPDYYSDLADFLNQYTSAKNGEPLKYVDNPMASDVEYTGRWRQAYVREYVDNAGDHFVMQVLRKGYIETLLVSGALDWTEARLVDGLVNDGDTFGSHRTYEEDNNTAQRFLTVTWNNVSPYKVNAIEAELLALGYATFNPVIRGENYSGQWNRLIVSKKIEEDGSATVTLVLAKPRFNLEAYVNYDTPEHEDIIYLYDVPQQIAQDVLETYKSEGRTASVGRQSKSGLVDIVIRGRDEEFVDLYDATTERGCMYIETTYYYWGYTKDAMDAIVGPYMSTTTDGTIKSLSLSVRSDGLYDFRMSERSAQAVSYTNVETEKSFGFTETTSYYWNYTQASMNALIVSFMGAAVDGERRSVGISKNTDCTYNFQLVVREGSATSALTIRTLNSCMRVEDTKYYWGYTKTAMQAIIDDYMATTTDGSVKTSSISYSPSDGLFNFTLSTQTVVKVSYAGVATEKAFGYTETTSYYWNQTQAECDIIINAFMLAYEDGEKRAVAVSKNPDCTYNLQCATRAGGATTALTIKTLSSCMKVENTQYYWGHTKDSMQSIIDAYMADEEDGKVKTSTISYSPTDGLFNFSLSTQEVQAVSAASIQTASGEGYTDTTSYYWNYALADMNVLIGTFMGTVASGETRNVSIDKNPDCTYNFRLTLRAFDETGLATFWPSAYWVKEEDELVPHPTDKTFKVRLSHIYQVGSRYSSNKTTIENFLAGNNVYGKPLVHFVSVPSRPVAGTLWYGEGAHYLTTTRQVVAVI